MTPKRLISHAFNLVDIDHQRIAKGLVLVMVFTLIGKSVAIGKEIAIAYRFGMGEIVDQYMFVLIFVTWISSVWISILNSVYVPLIHKIEPKEKERFAAQITGITLLVAALVTLLATVILPEFLAKFYGPLSETSQQSLVFLLRGMAPLTGLGIVVGHFSVQLLAEEKHANTLADAIPPFVLMLFVIFWPNNQNVNPFLWGSLVGWTLAVLGLYSLLRYTGHWITPNLSFSSSAWTNFRKGIGIMTMGVVVMSIGGPVSAVIASRLSEGNVSGYGYATRIIGLFLTLGGAAVSRATLPVMSNTQRDFFKIKRLALQWSALMFLLGIVCAAMFWILGPMLVPLLLERGQFQPEDSLAVAQAVKFGSLQLPLYFAGLVLVQFFVSLQLYKHIFVSALVAIAAKISFSLILSREYEFAGIVLADVPMYAATGLFFFCSILLIKSDPGDYGSR